MGRVQSRIIALNKGRAVSFYPQWGHDTGDDRRVGARDDDTLAPNCPIATGIRSPLKVSRPIANFRYEMGAGGRSICHNGGVRGSSTIPNWGNIMTTLYIICLTVGGVFVALAAFAGLDGADFELEFDPDVELADRRNPTESGGVLQPKRRSPRLTIPFLSLRFWTFGACFFGLTGTILSFLSPTLTPTAIAAISLAVGVFCGAAVVWIFDILRSQQANSMVQSDDLIGLGGTVEIPFDRDSRGKVRLSVKGCTFDMGAMTEESREFSPGDRVLVVGMEKNRVWVVSEDALK